MKLTQVAITRPLAVTMAILALVLMGLIAHARLGVDLLPSVTYPYISVSVTYPGASPTDVETLITKPVEDAVAGLPNAQHVSSTSQEGLSRVVVQFADGTDTGQAAIDVEQAINGIKTTLPSDALAPTISKFDSSSQPVLLVTVAGDRPPAQLFTLADQTIKPRLEGLDGVAAVSVFGGLDREIDVNVDVDRLRAHGVTIQQVVQALQQGNQAVPSGAIDAGNRRYDIRVTAEATQPADLAKLVVANAGARPVRVGDVATVLDTYKQQTVLTRANGHAAVALAVYKQSTANTVSVADTIHHTLDGLRAGLPQGVQVGTIFDNSTSTRQSLDDVNRNLIEAILITGVVLLFFLHNVRSMFIVLLAIPTSLISTYAVMYALGFTLNLLSLMALALLISILVDDSIVVLENIHRHLHKGEAPRQAALNGRTEIGLAAIAITLVDVVVYTPVAYMSGQIGAFFRQFGLTITAATLFSLLVSFTLTPMLASRWLGQETAATNSAWRRFGQRWDDGLAALAVRYGRLVSWAVDRVSRRLLVIGVSVGLLLASVTLVPLHVVGTEFVPDSDQGLFTVNAEMPVGTSLDATSQLLDRLDHMLLALPETDQTLALAGSGGTSGGDQARFGVVYVQLKPKSARQRSDKQLVALVQQQADQMPNARIRVVIPNIASGSGQPVAYRIQGTDVAALAQLGDRVAAAIASVPGTANVRNSGTGNLAQDHVQVDQDKLADFGLAAAAVASTVRTAVQGTVATEFRPPDQTQVDVRVIADPSERQDPAALLDLPIVAPNGAQVTVGQVATLGPTTGPSQIDRYDRLRQITISADLTDRSLGDVTADVQAKLKTIALPPGYKFVQSGTASDQSDAFTSLLQALALSVVLMYMLMVALYESFFTPFVIMFSLPMALVGAIVALALTGNTLNVLSMIGVIMLMGLVAKNAILLVDYTNTLRARGLDRAEAIREAGQARLRPILMTTSAMVLAMLPLSLKIGAGAETRASMGVVLVGGLLSSLLLTLVLVPVMYVTGENVTRRLGRFGRLLLRPFSRPRLPGEGSDIPGDWTRPPETTREPALAGADGN